MSRLSALILFAFSVIFATNASFGDDPRKDTQIRIVHGTFTDGTGKPCKFSVPQGGALKLTHKVTNQTYRLVPEKFGRDRVVLAVVDAVSDTPIERFDLPLDGQTRPGRVLPFSLGVTSMTIQKRPTRDSQLQKAVKEVGEAGPSCCIDCGDYTWCCVYVGDQAETECCGLECSSGDSCTVCVGEV